MTRRGLAPIILYWVLSMDPSCMPFTLQLYDAYLDGPGTMDYTEGWHNLPPSQTAIVLAAGKPDLGCAVAWRFPVALDIEGSPLPDNCQPTGFNTSEGAWDGM